MWAAVIVAAMAAAGSALCPSEPQAKAAIDAAVGATPAQVIVSQSGGECYAVVAPLPGADPMAVCRAAAGSTGVWASLHSATEATVASALVRAVGGEAGALGGYASSVSATTVAVSWFDHSRFDWPSPFAAPNAGCVAVTADGALATRQSCTGLPVVCRGPPATPAPTTPGPTPAPTPAPPTTPAPTPVPVPATPRPALRTVTPTLPQPTPEPGTTAPATAAPTPAPTPAPPRTVTPTLPVTAAPTPAPAPTAAPPTPGPEPPTQAPLTARCAALLRAAAPPAQLFALPTTAVAVGTAAPLPVAALAPAAPATALRDLCAVEGRAVTEDNMGAVRVGFVASVLGCSTVAAWQGLLPAASGASAAVVVPADALRGEGPVVGCVAPSPAALDVEAALAAEGCCPDGTAGPPLSGALSGTLQRHPTGGALALSATAGVAVDTVRIDDEELPAAVLETADAALPSTAPGAVRLRVPLRLAEAHEHSPATAPVVALTFRGAASSPAVTAPAHLQGNATALFLAAGTECGPTATGPALQVAAVADPASRDITVVLPAAAIAAVTAAPQRRAVLCARNATTGPVGVEVVVSTMAVTALPAVHRQLAEPAVAAVVPVRGVGLHPGVRVHFVGCGWAAAATAGTPCAKGRVSLAAPAAAWPNATVVALGHVAANRTTEWGVEFAAAVLAQPTTEPACLCLEDTTAMTAAHRFVPLPPRLSVSVAALTATAADGAAVLRVGYGSAEAVTLRGAGLDGARVALCSQLTADASKLVPALRDVRRAALPGGAEGVTATVDARLYAALSIASGAEHSADTPLPLCAVVGPRRDIVQPLGLAVVVAQPSAAYAGGGAATVVGVDEPAELQACLLGNCSAADYAAATRGVWLPVAADGTFGLPSSVPSAAAHGPHAVQFVATPRRDALCRALPGPRELLLLPPPSAGAPWAAPLPVPSWHVGPGAVGQWCIGAAATDGSSFRVLPGALVPVGLSVRRAPLADVPAGVVIAKPGPELSVSTADPRTVLVAGPLPSRGLVLGLTDTAGAPWQPQRPSRPVLRRADGAALVAGHASAPVPVSHGGLVGAGPTADTIGTAAVAQALLATPGTYVLSPDARSSVAWATIVVGTAAPGAVPSTASRGIRTLLGFPDGGRVVLAQGATVALHVEAALGAAVGSPALGSDGLDGRWFALTTAACSGLGAVQADGFPTVPQGAAVAPAAAVAHGHLLLAARGIPVGAARLCWQAPQGGAWVEQGAALRFAVAMAPPTAVAALTLPGANSTPTTAAVFSSGPAPRLSLFGGAVSAGCAMVAFPAASAAPCPLLRRQDAVADLAVTDRTVVLPTAVVAAVEGGERLRLCYAPPAGPMVDTALGLAPADRADTARDVAAAGPRRQPVVVNAVWPVSGAVELLGAVAQRLPDNSVVAFVEEGRGCAWLSHSKPTAATLTARALGGYVSVDPDTAPGHYALCVATVPAYARLALGPGTDLGLTLRVVGGPGQELPRGVVVVPKVAAARTLAVHVAAHVFDALTHSAAGKWVPVQGPTARVECRLNAGAVRGPVLPILGQSAVATPEAGLRAAVPAGPAHGPERRVYYRLCLAFGRALFLATDVVAAVPTAVITRRSTPTDADTAAAHAAAAVRRALAQGPLPCRCAAVGAGPVAVVAPLSAEDRDAHGSSGTAAAPAVAAQLLVPRNGVRLGQRWAPWDGAAVTVAVLPAAGAVWVAMAPPSTYECRERCMSAGPGVRVVTAAASAANATTLGALRHAVLSLRSGASVAFADGGAELAGPESHAVAVAGLAAGDAVALQGSGCAAGHTVHGVFSGAGVAVPLPVALSSAPAASVVSLRDEGVEQAAAVAAVVFPNRDAVAASRTGRTVTAVAITGGVDRVVPFAPAGCPGASDTVVATARATLTAAGDPRPWHSALGRAAPALPVAPLGVARLGNNCSDVAAVASLAPARTAAGTVYTASLHGTAVLGAAQGLPARFATELLQWCLRPAAAAPWAPLLVTELRRTVLRAALPDATSLDAVTTLAVKARRTTPAVIAVTAERGLLTAVRFYRAACPNVTRSVQAEDATLTTCDPAHPALVSGAVVGAVAGDAKRSFVLPPSWSAAGVTAATCLCVTAGPVVADGPAVGPNTTAAFVPATARVVVDTVGTPTSLVALTLHFGWADPAAAATQAVHLTAAAASVAPALVRDARSAVCGYLGQRVARAECEAVVQVTAGPGATEVTVYLPALLFAYSEAEAAAATEFLYAGIRDGFVTVAANATVADDARLGVELVAVAGFYVSNEHGVPAMPWTATASAPPTLPPSKEEQSGVAFYIAFLAICLPATALIAWYAYKHAAESAEGVGTPQSPGGPTPRPGAGTDPTTDDRYLQPGTAASPPGAPALGGSPSPRRPDLPDVSQLLGACPADDPTSALRPSAGGIRGAGNPLYDEPLATGAPTLDTASHNTSLVLSGSENHRGRHGLQPLQRPPTPGPHTPHLGPSSASSRGTPGPRNRGGSGGHRPPPSPGAMMLAARALAIATPTTGADLPTWGESPRTTPRLGPDAGRGFSRSATPRLAPANPAAFDRQGTPPLRPRRPSPMVPSPQRGGTPGTPQRGPSPAPLPPPLHPPPEPDLGSGSTPTAADALTPAPRSLPGSLARGPPQEERRRLDDDDEEEVEEAPGSRGATSPLPQSDPAQRPQAPVSGPHHSPRPSLQRTETQQYVTPPSRGPGGGPGGPGGPSFGSPTAPLPTIVAPPLGSTLPVSSSPPGDAGGNSCTTPHHRGELPTPPAAPDTPPPEPPGEDPLYGGGDDEEEEEEEEDTR